MLCVQEFNADAVMQKRLPATARVTAIRAVWITAFLGLAVTSGNAAQISFGDMPIANPVAAFSFSEVDLYTTDPVFDSTLIPALGDFTVSFGSLFFGQVPGDMDNSLITTMPEAPLGLDGDGPQVATLLDLKSGTPPVLGGASGSRFFATPVAMLFEPPVSEVSFTLGSLDAPGTTFVEAFDQQANSLGVTQNTVGGFETISLQSSSADISGVSVYLMEPLEDWEGFGLDNVAVVPEPATHVLVTFFVAWLAMLRRRD